MRSGSKKEIRPGVHRLRYDAPADPAQPGRRSQLTATFRGTEREAQRELDRRLAEAEAGIAAPARLTLAAHLEKWLRLAAPALKPATVENYTHQVARLTAGLGAVPLAKLTAYQIQEHYARELEAGLKPSSLSVEHSVLRRALRQARKWKLLAVLPTEDVELPRVRRPDPQALPLPDLRRMLDAARGGPLYVPLVVLVVLGIRKGELLGLQWADLSWESGTLRVERQLLRGKGGLRYGPPKWDSERTQAVPGFALDALRAHWLAQEKARSSPAWTEHGLIFPKPDAGRPWHPNTFTQAYARVLRDADLPWVNLHRLRHSQISLSHAAGIPPRVIQARAGHASAAQTMAYTHLLPGQDTDAAARLDEVFREGL